MLLRKFAPLALLVIIAPLLLGNSGCEDVKDTKSASGIKKAVVQVQTGADGLSTEQRNIKDRLLEDNKLGSIKHLYVISAYSGQVLIYSTVRGKVTSGGKRLTPTSVVVGSQGEYKRPGFAVKFGEAEMATSEVLQDDGAYGHSMDYLYWWGYQGRLSPALCLGRPDSAHLEPAARGEVHRHQHGDRSEGTGVAVAAARVQQGTREIPRNRNSLPRAVFFLAGRRNKFYVLRVRNGT